MATKSFLLTSEDIVRRDDNCSRHDLEQWNVLRARVSYTDQHVALIGKMPIPRYLFAFLKILLEGSDVVTPDVFLIPSPRLLCSEFR